MFVLLNHDHGGREDEEKEEEEEEEEETFNDRFLSSSAMIDELRRHVGHGKKKKKAAAVAATKRADGGSTTGHDDTEETNNNNDNDYEDVEHLKHQITRATVHTDGHLVLQLLDGSTCSVPPTPLSLNSVTFQPGDAVVSVDDDNSCARATVVRTLLRDVDGVEVELASSGRTVEPGCVGKLLLDDDGRLPLSDDESKKEKKKKKESAAASQPATIVIEDGLFRGCRNLEKVNVSRSAEVILGQELFQDCESLTTVKLPSSLRLLSKRIFQNCRSLSIIDLPTSLEQIDYGAFQGCVSLRRIDLPESVAIILEGAFDGCTLLTQFRLPKEVMSKVQFFLMDRSAGRFDLRIGHDYVALSHDLALKWPGLIEEHGPQACEMLGFSDMDLANEGSPSYQHYSFLLHGSKLGGINFTKCKLDQKLFIATIQHLAKAHALTSFECDECTFMDGEITEDILRSIVKILGPLELEDGLSLFGLDFGMCEDDSVALTVRKESKLDIWAQVLNPQDGYWPECARHVTLENLSAGQGLAAFLVNVLCRLPHLDGVYFSRCRMLVDDISAELSVMGLPSKANANEAEYNLHDNTFISKKDPEFAMYALLGAMFPYQMNCEVWPCRLSHDTTKKTTGVCFKGNYSDYQHWARFALLEYDARAPTLDEVVLEQIDEQGESLEKFDSCLSEIICSKPSVDHLSFFNCSTKLLKLPQFLKALRSHSHLKSFTTDYSLQDFVSVGGLEAIFQHPLEALHLCGIPMVPDDAHRLSRHLKVDTTLKILGLNNCRLNDTWVYTLLQSLAHNQSLETLDLSSHNTSLTCSTRWMSELAGLKRLRNLTMPHNAIEFYDYEETSELDWEDEEKLLYQNMSLFSLTVTDEHGTKLPVPDRVGQFLYRNECIHVVSSDEFDKVPLSAIPNLLQQLHEKTVLFKYLEKYCDILIEAQTSKRNGTSRPLKKTQPIAAREKKKLCCSAQGSA